jgi:hypothetical protein
MPWKIGENIIAGQVSATPKQDPGVSRYTKPMPRNGLESINSGASSCRYKYPRELRNNEFQRREICSNVSRERNSNFLDVTAA